MPVGERKRGGGIVQLFIGVVAVAGLAVALNRDERTARIVRRVTTGSSG